MGVEEGKPGNWLTVTLGMLLRAEAEGGEDAGEPIGGSGAEEAREMHRGGQTSGCRGVGGSVGEALPRPWGGPWSCPCSCPGGFWEASGRTWEGF